jgi:hypothetical protein
MIAAPIAALVCSAALAATPKWVDVGTANRARTGSAHWLIDGHSVERDGIAVVYVAKATFAKKLHGASYAVQTLDFDCSSHVTTTREVTFYSATGAELMHDKPYDEQSSPKGSLFYEVGQRLCAMTE